MKYSVNNYVEAFVQATDGKPNEKAVKSFVELLAKTGDIRHAIKIFEAIEKRLTNKDGGRWVNVETARELTKQQLKLLNDNFLDKDHIEFKINESLVAGTRITVNGEEELDNTLANKLKKLFA